MNGRANWTFLSPCSDFHLRIMSVFKAAIKITSIQKLFSALSRAHRNVSRFFESFDYVDDEIFIIICWRIFSKIVPQFVDAGFCRFVNIWPSLPLRNPGFLRNSFLYPIMPEGYTMNQVHHDCLCVVGLKKSKTPVKANCYPDCDYQLSLLSWALCFRLCVSSHKNGCFGGIISHKMIPMSATIRDAIRW